MVSYYYKAKYPVQSVARALVVRVKVMMLFLFTGSRCASRLRIIPVRV